MSELDLIVVGGGSAGVRAARFAASHGARVVLVESDRLGGTCVNVGCVPKKLLAQASQHGAVQEEMRAEGWGITPATLDWPTLRAGVDREVERLNGAYARMLERAGVEVVFGRAKVVSPNAVRVGERRLEGRNLAIVTGGRPWRPELPGAALTWTSDDLFRLPALPRRIVIVGGGYIGCEFASILAGFGVSVDLLVRGPSILTGFDHDVVAVLEEALAGRGIRVHTGQSPVTITDGEGGRVVRTSDLELEADGVLMATGRVPNTAGLGLEAIGVQLAKDGAIVVDHELRTSVPSVYACGDVIDRVALTPVAIAEGSWLAQHLFGTNTRTLDYTAIPTAVFTSPQVGTVGLTEAQARSKGHDVAVFLSRFRALDQAISGRSQRSLVKVLVDRPSDRVLGFHVVASAAAEVLQGFAAALVAGVTKATLDATLGIHPTVAEELVTLRQEFRE